MVFLALTRAGLVDALAAAASSGAAVWCGADTVSEADYAALLRPGLDISRFDYPLGGPDSADIVEGALATIAEHHPGATLWVEHPSAAD